LRHALGRARVVLVAAAFAGVGAQAVAQPPVIQKVEPPSWWAGYSINAVYLIRPDRLANGDPSNDDPAKAHGLTDRSQTRFYHGGDLAGILQRLTYLESLGMSTL
jgi:hypothetical protein